MTHHDTTHGPQLSSPHEPASPPADLMEGGEVERARVARWEFLVQNTASYWPRQKAEEAMRLADEEQAELVAENKRLAYGWKCATAERERLETNLSSLLCDLTGGLLSKTTYEVATMVREIEAYFEETGDTERAQTAEYALIQARARAESAEAEVERLRVRLAKVEALHVVAVNAIPPTAPDWCVACGRTWPCPTIAAVADAPTEQIKGGE